MRPGAYTLRNDDSDGDVGPLARSTLPIQPLPTDIDRTGNANENDLVRVDVANPAGTPNVYLFAFALASEASRAPGTPVTIRSKSARQANADELATFGDATKAAPTPAFAVAIGAEGKTFWIEGRLGGRYRLALGALDADAKNPPAKVQYDVAKETPVPPLRCLEQATLTVVVVDVSQAGKDQRRDTAFDVFWGGIPLFHAEAWPQGGAYEWAVDYPHGREVRRPPGRARDGRAGFMTLNPDGEPEANATKSGEPVTARGMAGGAANPGAKASFVGGLEVHTPLAGDAPVVNADAGNRYPHRISVAYAVEGERLVRAEPLEVILPRLREIPAAQSITGDASGVESSVPYRIVDAFRRPIVAWNTDEYVRFYGAGLKAWEALAPLDGHATEERDDLRFVNLPAGAPPFPLGTAQRSEAAVRADRMKDGVFTDTLRLSPGVDGNAFMRYWKAWTGRETNADVGQAREEATVRAEAYRRSARNPGARARLAADDQARARRFPLLAIRQDVILQLRAGDRFHDICVLHANTLTIYAPYFLSSLPAAGGPETRSFRLEFRPGTDASPHRVEHDHLRPR